MNDAINKNPSYQLSNVEFEKIQKDYKGYNLRVEYMEERKYKNYTIYANLEPTISSKEDIKKWYRDLEDKKLTYKNGIEEIKLKRVIYADSAFSSERAFAFEIDENDKRITGENIFNIDENTNEEDLTNTSNSNEFFDKEENDNDDKEENDNDDKEENDNDDKEENDNDDKEENDNNDGFLDTQYNQGENDGILTNLIDSNANNSLTSVDLQTDCGNATVRASITIKESEKDMEELAEGMQLAIENKKGKELLDAFARAGFIVNYETNNINSNGKSIADALKVVRDFKGINFPQANISQKATTKYVEDDVVVKQKLEKQISEINNAKREKKNYSKQRVKEIRNIRSRYDITKKFLEHKNRKNYNNAKSQINSDKNEGSNNEKLELKDQVEI